MTTRTPERTEFLIDILNTAAEGGVNYWANVRGYRWDLTKHPIENIGMEIQDIEAEPDHTWHTVNLDTIDAGIDRILTEEVPYLSDDMRRCIEDSVGDLDASNLDADAADTIVQVALFGEVVYC